MGTTGNSGRSKGSSAAPGGNAARKPATPGGKSGGKSGAGPAPKSAPKSAPKTAPKPGGKGAAKPKMSAKVYRRRRMVAAVLALLVVAAVVAGGFFVAGLVGAGANGDAQGIPAVNNSTTEKAKQGAKVGTPPSAVCDEAGINVSATVDKPSYAAEEKPVLTLRVTNSGKANCDINVGTSQMEFQITSGDDIIFNSKFCQMDPTDLVKNLAPGASETANMVWQVNRTAPDCAKVVSEPGRGGGTYVLVATLGKWSSDKVTFTLQ